MMTTIVILMIVLAAICVFCIMRLRTCQTELDAARQEERMKSVFLKALVYEIRTSVHAITGLSTTMAREDLYLSKSEKRTISEQIQWNTSQVSTLLDEVAIYTEGENGGHKIEDEPFMPFKVCQRCVDANLANVKEGVTLRLDNTVGDALTVSTDRHLVELMLNKLVFCACRFTERGEIVVGYRFQPQPRVLTFSVSDTGVGVPEARRQNLFSWFEQPDSTVDLTEFTLSAARRMAEKMGGYLRQDATYTHGTRMELVLPVR